MLNKILFVGVVLLTSPLLFANAKIENDKMSIEFDDNANLVSLKNKIDNIEYAGGQGLWRAIYSLGDVKEIPVECENQKASVEKVSESKIKISYNGEFPVEVTCELVDDSAFFKAKVTNNSKDKILRELQFPLIKNIQNISDKTTLIDTRQIGRQTRKFVSYVKYAHTEYIATDNKAVERVRMYPNGESMNFFVLMNKGHSFSLASNDPNFERTLHLYRYRVKKGEFKYLDIGMVKYPFIKSGESYQTAEFEISANSGDWRVAAKKYRRAADKLWFKLPTIPDSIKNMNGWHRVILRHQYRDNFFSYPELQAKINKAGKECGVDSILMFGWWKEGMDAGYPAYSPDDEKGGDAELKKQIANVQANGGKVLVYFNGQLIDVESKFYKSGVGEKVSVKTPSGFPHIERYMFGGNGTGLRTFGNKTFVTACMATKEWEDVLKSFVDRVIALGADGIFLDQLGNETTPSACFDKSHGHKVPCIDAMKYKSEVLRKIREYIKSKNPNMSFGIEKVGDSSSMYVDYVHGTARFYEIGGKERNGKPWLKAVPVFNYTFPELKSSDRTIRDDKDIARRMNLCLMWGLISDIEIYRCRDTIDETPTYKAYMVKANALRDKYRDLIFNGLYRDRDLAECSNDKLDYTTFENDKQIAVFVTNSWSDKKLSGVINVKGAKFVKADGLGNYKTSGENGKIKVELDKHDLSLLIFEK